ncbi:MAG: protoporphyrinogen oxidase, partial [Firmicutes bacterium]|nr:protoporphyrinogen oxidase [Bacillota bacterium]
MKRRAVAVVGGGLTGLAAAFELSRETGVNVTLFEQSGVLGGKVQTSRGDNAALELGPDSFLARKTEMVDLLDELGLLGEVVGAGPSASRTFIGLDGALHPFPPGGYMGIPLTKEAILTSPFISDAGKRRALQDFEQPCAAPAGDESLGDMLVRRLGEELVSRVAEAVMSGIYGGNIKDLSLLSTFPELREAEVRHGSLLRGLQARVAAARAAQVGVGRVEAAGQGSRAGLPGGAFLTLRRGLRTVVDALGERLKSAGVTVSLRSRVDAVTHRAGQRAGYELSGQDHTGNAWHAEFDGAVMTAPAYAAASMLAAWPDVASELADIEYASSAIVTLAYAATELPAPAGSGFVIPRCERSAITACTWLSSKWPHCALAGQTVLRAFVGRAGDEALVHATDEQMIAAVRRDLALYQGVDVTPERV